MTLRCCGGLSCLFHWRALAYGKVLELPIKFDQPVAAAVAILQAIPQRLRNIGHDVVSACGCRHGDGCDRVDVTTEVDAVDQEVGHALAPHKRCDGSADAVAPLGADRSFVRAGPAVSGHM